MISNILHRISKKGKTYSFLGQLLHDSRLVLVILDVSKIHNF